MKRLFEIQTLSDHNYTSLKDPVSVITGGVAIIQGLFPNLFGGGRRRLTNQDWLQMFPGNGMYTVRLRNCLSRSIHFDSDLMNIEEFTRNFVFENMSALPGANFTEKFQSFLSIINEEKFTGGKSPGGMIPGISGGLDYSTLLPIAAIGLVLVFAMKKKKK